MLQHFFILFDKIFYANYVSHYYSGNMERSKDSNARLSAVFYNSFSTLKGIDIGDSSIVHYIYRNKINTYFCQFFLEYSSIRSELSSFQIDMCTWLTWSQSLQTAPLHLIINCSKGTPMWLLMHFFNCEIVTESLVLMKGMDRASMELYAGTNLKFKASLI